MNLISQLHHHHPHKLKWFSHENFLNSYNQLWNNQKIIRHHYGNCSNLASITNQLNLTKRSIKSLSTTATTISINRARNRKRENSEFLVRRESPSLVQLELFGGFGFGKSTTTAAGATATSRKHFLPTPSVLLGLGNNQINYSFLTSCPSLRHRREFHTSVGVGNRRMSSPPVLSPTSLTPLGSSKSPMTSTLNLTGEGDDDIGALSAGFDRRRTLRRRLSTAFDPGESESKQIDKLIAVSQHRESINEDEELPLEALDKPKDLKVQDVLGQLENVISYRGRNVSHIIVEKAVKELCTAYDYLEEPEKLVFLNTLALKYSVDNESVKKLGQLLVESKDENTQLNIHEKLRTALIPRYQWLFSQIGRLEGGVKFLVDFRTDLSEISQKYSDNSLHLRTMNNTLRDKIEMWFAIGFLNLERVTWNSPCDMLQKISEYEAVHPMRNWTDLKRRVGNYRRCYVFTHGSMPGEPVVVLHTALTDHIPSSIGYIVTNSRMRLMSVDSGSDLGRATEDAGTITTAIFYSITSTQKGLAGIELGNYLIKRVVKELQKEFPKMAVFSSLSPIPGFRSWFLNELKGAQKNSTDVPKLVTEDELNKLGQILECELSQTEVLTRIHCLISQNDWVEDEALVALLEHILMRHCARYLVQVKRRGFALNSVANFHLKNGAVVWRLNWKANTKPWGLSEACGIMVNYRYFLDDCEKNSQEYMENQKVKTSDQVKHLLRSFSNDASSPTGSNSVTGNTN